MIGLYNSFIGMHPMAKALVHSLEITPEEVPRFRDAYYERTSSTDLGHIVILTRTGGANRSLYPDGINLLRKNPLYIEDQDEPFDPTYAVFKFKLPPSLEPYVEHLNNMPPYGSLADRFERALIAIRGDKP